MDAADASASKTFCTSVLIFVTAGWPSVPSQDAGALQMWVTSAEGCTEFQFWQLINMNDRQHWDQLSLNNTLHGQKSIMWHFVDTKQDPIQINLLVANESHYKDIRRCLGEDTITWMRVRSSVISSTALQSMLHICFHQHLRWLWMYSLVSDLSRLPMWLYASLQTRWVYYVLNNK